MRIIERECALHLRRYPDVKATDARSACASEQAFRILFKFRGNVRRDERLYASLN